MRTNCYSGINSGDVIYILEIRRSLSVDYARVEISINARSASNSFSSKYKALLNQGQTETCIKLSNFYDNYSRYGNRYDINSRFPVNGNVTVSCSKEKVETQTVNGNSSLTNQPIPSPQLVSDFLRLLDNPDSFSDATLVCGSAKIAAHRNILSARSPVFAAMFKTQMQEGRDSVIDIVDIEHDVLQAMLKYIYSGKTDHLTHSMAGDLLFAADKYQLEELKLTCVKKLKESMAVNNVFRSLVLGDMHEKSLKVHAVEFICKYNNFSDLEKTEEWQILMKEHPALALEVATTALKYLQKTFGCTKNI